MPGQQHRPPAQQAPQQQAPQQAQEQQGWMSWTGEKLWNAGSAVASGVGGFASSIYGGEQDNEGGKTEFDSDPSWEGGIGAQEADPSWMERGVQAVAPSIGRKSEKESVRKGSENLGLGYSKEEAEARFGKDGLSAKKSREVAGFHAKGETDRHATSTRVGDVFGEAEGEVSGLSAGYEAEAQIGKTGASGKVGAGAYLGKAEAEGTAGWRIPGTNVALTFTGGVEGSYGVGGEVSGQAGWGEDGFQMGGKASGALGIGGGLGFGFGVGKFDKDKGWFDRGADQAQPQPSAPAPSTGP